MEKIIWRHPNCHDEKTWVEGFKLKDKKGFYIATSEDSVMKIYLKNNKGIIVKKVLDKK